MGEGKADTSLVATRERFSSVLKRHGQLARRLSRYSDRTVYECLQREYEAACFSITQEICLDGEKWNDGHGLLATITESVHLEVESRGTIQLPGEPRSSTKSEHRYFAALMEQESALFGGYVD